jgi:class 3 adenylate cyclase
MTANLRGAAEGRPPEESKPDAMDPQSPGPPAESVSTEAPSQTEDTVVRVIFFSDMKGSAALKEDLAERWDEDAFQRLRQEHDSLLIECITRDRTGQILKATGDGFLAIFTKPSIAVERAMEIQEKLRGHPHVRVRIGIDIGEVRIESAGGATRDVFGRHVDWAARAMAMADGGHICVTRPVYADAFSWITKSRIAWKEHGFHRVKAGDPPLEIFEPYNANLTTPMDRLAGEKVAPPLGAAADGPRERPEKIHPLRIVRSWEQVARDGRDFAERGAGMMYWFKVPLGGLSYPEGFRNFLQPALTNPRITKIRFLLEATVPGIRRTWQEIVLPQIQSWAVQENRTFVLEQPDEHSGRLVEAGPPVKSVAWVFVDLSMEFTPCFKLLCSDPDTDVASESEAQIFLSTSSRTVRWKDGTLHSVRIPDAILRVKASEEDSLIYALNTVANQWDMLFS